MTHEKDTALGRKSNLLKDYPDEALLEEVRRVAGLVGRPVLTHADFAKHSGISTSTFARRFGKWRTVLECAGLVHLYSGEAECWQKRYSDEALLEEVRRVAEIVGKPVLTRADFKQHSKVDQSNIRLRFGGWRVALERAGVGHMFSKSGGKTNGSYLDGELLEEVRRVAGLVEKPVLTRADFIMHSTVDPSTISIRFGSWREALEKAGLGDMYSGGSHATLGRFTYTDAELLEEVRRVAQLVDKSVLTQAVFKQYSKIDPSNINRRLGSWSVALQRAGLYHMFSKISDGYSEAELLEEVCRVAGLVEKPVLTRADFIIHSGITTTVIARFGGWRAVLERAGMGYMYSGVVRYTDEELLTEIRRVAQLVGKPVLTQVDFRRHAKVDTSNISARFGNWGAALERAGVGHMYYGGRDSASRRIHRLVHSDEWLLEEVRRVAKLIKKPMLTTTDFDSHSSIDSATPRARFGCWRDVLEQAGIGHMYSGRKMRPKGISRSGYPEEVLLEEVRRVAKLVDGPVLSKASFHKHSIIAVKSLRQFGDWREVLERAGVGHMYSGKIVNARQRSGVRYNDDEVLLAEVRRVAQLIEKPALTKTDFDKHSEISAETLNRRFGNWHNVLERAGVGHLCGHKYFAQIEEQDHFNWHHYPDEVLLEEVRRAAHLVTKPTLSRTDFEKLSGISSHTASRRFGDWREVLEKAGVPHMYSGQRISDRKRSAIRYASNTDVINIIRRAAAKGGRNDLSYNDFYSMTGVGWGTIRRRFGDWRKALEAAGLSGGKNADRVDP